MKLSFEQSFRNTTPIEYDETKSLDELINGNVLNNMISKYGITSITISDIKKTDILNSTLELKNFNISSLLIKISEETPSLDIKVIDSFIDSFTISSESLIVDNLLKVEFLRVFGRIKFQMLKLDLKIFNSMFNNNSHILFCDIERIMMSNSTFINGRFTKNKVFKCFMSYTNFSHTYFYDNTFKNTNRDLLMFYSCTMDKSEHNNNCCLYDDDRPFNYINVFKKCLCVNEVGKIDGDIIGWKKCFTYDDKKNRIYWIVELFIPRDAQRSSSTTNKCRCDKALVSNIYKPWNPNITINEVSSIHNVRFKYKKGSWVSVDDFDENPLNECSSGIHFFTEEKNAMNYLT